MPPQVLPLTLALLLAFGGIHLQYAYSSVSHGLLERSGARVTALQPFREQLILTTAVRLDAATIAGPMPGTGRYACRAIGERRRLPSDGFI